MIRLRAYAPDDRAAVQAVFYRAVHEGAAGHYTAAQRAAWAPGHGTDADRPDRLAGQFCLLSESAGQVTGFMSLCDDGYLDMAFVLPDVMGKGHAAALYSAILAEAQRRRLPRLTAHASLLARPFLERRGWNVEQVQDHPVGQVTLRRFAMQILLKPCAAPPP